MDVARIAKVTFTSPDRVREVINNFNDDGFESLYPIYASGRPPTFSLPQRAQIKKIALSRPGDHGLPFSTWSLAKLAEFLVAEGVVDDISMRACARSSSPRRCPFKWSKPSRFRPTRTTRRRRIGCWSCTTSQKAELHRGRMTRAWCSRWTSSAR
jgi:transposase